MVLGFLEIFMMLGLIMVLFGPTIIKRIQQYRTLFAKRNRRLQKVAAQRKAEELARRQIRNTKIKIAVFSALAASLVFGAIYLAYWPVSLQVNAYQPDQTLQLDVDLYGAAQTVQDAEALTLAGYGGVTQVRFYNDWVYAAVSGGKILRIRENGTGLTELVSTGGEILSFDFDAEGNIIFTDAQYDEAGGALLKASFDGFAVTVVPLVSGVAGDALACPTAVQVAADGTIYFLNAAQVNVRQQGSTLQALRTAQAAHLQDGTLYAYDPASQTCQPMLTGLGFGAGLALSPQQDTLYLSELTTATIWSLDVTTRGATLGDGTAEPLCSLPGGYAAGLSLGTDGTLWVAMLSQEMPWFESLRAQPAWREVLLRLPQGTRDALMQYNGAGLVVALDAQGQWVGSYALAGKQSLSMLTDVCTQGNRVYLAQGGTKGSLAYFTL